MYREASVFMLLGRGYTHTCVHTCTHTCIICRVEKGRKAACSHLHSGLLAFHSSLFCSLTSLFLSLWLFGFLMALSSTWHLCLHSASVNQSQPFPFHYSLQYIIACFFRSVEPSFILPTRCLCLKPCFTNSSVWSLPTHPLPLRTTWPFRAGSRKSGR